MKGKNLPVTIVFIIGLLWAPLTLASETEALAVCESCHGKSGVSVNPLVPTLAGQPYTLIEDNLLAFRSGGRVCRQTPTDADPDSIPVVALAKTMCDAVAGLSDAEISTLATYFESQSFGVADQTFDAEKANKGFDIHLDNGCERCHSGGGMESNAMAPILAGQWTPYLRHAMKQIQSGRKKGPKMMNSAIHALNNDEVEALLHFYAGRPNGPERIENP